MHFSKTLLLMSQSVLACPKNIKILAPAIIMNDTATPTNTKRSALVAAVKRDTPNTIEVAAKAPKKSHQRDSQQTNK